MLNHFAPPRVILSDGVVGCGAAFFERAVLQGHEGSMATHLGGRYLPRRRQAGWRKIKPSETIPSA